MGKDFPDSSDFAYHPPVNEIGVGTAQPKTIAPAPLRVPASQSDRPQLRPVADPD